MTTTDHAPTDLLRALEAIQRTQQRWLQDVTTVSAGDPRFLDAFRRWEEWLTLIKLHIHRAEQRLLHLLMLPEDRRTWREVPHHQSDSGTTYRHWMRCVGPYFRGLHIDTSYRRIADSHDMHAEAVTADALTDLVALCEIAASTNQVLDRVLGTSETPEVIEDLAFFHIISPWKQLGMPAWFDWMRWLNEFLREHDEL